MSRDIRYRVWDGEKMHDSGHAFITIYGNSHSFLIAHHTDFSSRVASLHEESVSLQLARERGFRIDETTGREDVDGTPIFNNDILEYPHEPHVVKWCDERRAYGLFRDGKFRYHLNQSGVAAREGRVIGNVHEHPDLVTSYPDY